jgi:DNA-binding TFAR19-related protein (PDSD5 family)
MREAEKSRMLEDVARERLVKTHQAGKDLAAAVEISGDAVITCT